MQTVEHTNLPRTLASDVTRTHLVSGVWYRLELTPSNLRRRNLIGYKTRAQSVELCIA